MNNYSIGFYTLKFSTICGFAGYGAALALGANGKLSAIVGTIYGFTTMISPDLTAKYSNSKHDHLYRLMLSTSAIEIILIVASRAFGLIGNQGLIFFAGYTATRHFVDHARYAELKKQADART